MAMRVELDLAVIADISDCSFKTFPDNGDGSADVDDVVMLPLGAVRAACI